MIGQTIAFSLMIMLGFWLGSESRQDELNNLQTRIDDAFKHWDQRVGGTTLIEGADSYNLRTFDSGKNWYAVAYDDDWAMSIIGSAEDVFPGLINHLNGMKALTDHVESNGPITLKGGIEGKEASLLRKAGFELVSK